MSCSHNEFKELQTKKLDNIMLTIHTCSEHTQTGTYTSRTHTHTHTPVKLRFLFLILVLFISTQADNAWVNTQVIIIINLTSLALKGVHSYAIKFISHTYNLSWQIK